MVNAQSSMVNPQCSIVNAQCSMVKFLIFNFLPLLSLRREIIVVFFVYSEFILNFAARNKYEYSYDSITIKRTDLARHEHLG